MLFVEVVEVVEVVGVVGVVEVEVEVEVDRSVRWRGSEGGSGRLVR